MKAQTFPRIVMIETLLFPLQFLLGMAVNLFITIPDPMKGSFFDSFKGVLVDLHILNGLTIISLAVTISVLAKSFKTAMPFRFSLLAAVSILLAITGGVIFVFRGQVDAFSYTMSIGFAGAVVLYYFMGRAVMQMMMPK